MSSFYQKSKKLLRILAAIAYDSLIILAILLIATTLLFLICLLIGLPEPKPSNLYFRLYILAVIISYYHLCWSYIPNGQTIGMKTWSFKLASNRNKFTILQTLLRVFGGTIGFLTFGLGYILVYFNKQGKTFADYLSNSQIIAS